MVTEDDIHFMQLAVDLSQYALDSGNGGPFGALIVKDRDIIGSSGNCVYRDTDPCAHAEVLAVRDACNKLKSLDLSGCRIYTSSEPCPMCLAAIYWAQISSIYYCVSEDETLGFGYADKNLSEELRKPKENRKLKLIHVPNGKALGIFEKNLYKTGIRQT